MLPTVMCPVHYYIALTDHCIVLLLLRKYHDNDIGQTS